MKKLSVGVTSLLSIACFSNVLAYSQEGGSSNSSTTEITTKLTTDDNQTITAPIGEEGGGDHLTGINGLFGIAYVPANFSAKAELKDSGEQKIPLNNNNISKYNIGVKDKTRRKDRNWSLNTSISWDNDNNYLSGATIEAENVNVKENIDGKLQELSNDEVKFASNSLTISSVENTVMSSVKGKVLNGVYNYQFEDPQLVIPDASSVAPGSYVGNIHWNLVNAPSTDKPDDQIDELTNAINDLFDGEDLKDTVTQEMIDNLQQELDQLEDSQEKQELQEKLDHAQELLDARSFTQEIMVTDKPTNTLNAGIQMGNGHDRQDLGVQLEKGSKIKIKQTNPNFKEDLDLYLLTNDSETETYTTVSTNEIEVTAKDLCVPFIETPYTQENGEKPTVEVEIEGGKRELPKYNLETSFEEFSDKWNTNKGYALLQGSRFQTLFPEGDQEEVLSTDLDNVIDLYDNDIIGFYNELIGLSDQATDPINQTPNRRYFYKADIHGAGSLYYGGSWVAESSDTATTYLTDSWGALHETGHGYQGSFMNNGMSTGEVWNNIYGVIYDYNHLGKEEADQNSWLYQYGYKTELENTFQELVDTGNMNYEDQDYRGKLIILSNIVDKAGVEGLQNFYTKYREYASQSGFDVSNYLLPDMLVTNLGAPKKYDFSAVLTAWQVTVSEESQKLAKDQDYQLVSHLAQVVPDERLQEAVDQFTKSNRLSSVLSLVTNEELDEMNLKSNVTLHFPEKELFEGTNLKIYRDGQFYTEVPLNEESVTIDNMPNGVYSLELDSNVGYVSQPYLFVKDNRTINISLVNYVKEATQIVQSLYQEDSDKIKPEIRQKDIDHAREYVDALPESDEKSALLDKLEKAFNQLQEFTFKGLGDWDFATLNISNNLATIQIASGRPHSYFSEAYASIQITRDGKTIYNHDFIGDQSSTAEEKSITLETGDLVTITHLEADVNRLAVNHSDLLYNTDGVYYYIVEDGKLKVN
ncbi:toxin Cry1Ac domain D-VI-related protein [Enterococcus casseliflavus]|nr:toxin Cry1Ac domain D-VI-related protein [Enterococcus casseliflavus]